MVWFLRILLILFASLLVTGFLPVLLAPWPVPNLALGAVVFLMLTNRSEHAILWAMLGGIILDSTLPNYPLYTPLFVGLVLVTYLLGQRFGSQLPVGGYLVVATLIALLAATLETLVAGSGWGWYWLTSAAMHLVAIGLVWLLGSFSFRRKRLVIDVGL